MTLLELSVGYREQATTLKGRITQLRGTYPALDQDEKIRMDVRLQMLSAMWREARDLAVLCERYYDRGYRRNERYTI